eukprot:m.262673 g.262673  ORF g.262673 m.262673 type:complete len:173 (+) comp16223_c0_seq6:166-684(+)
MRLSWQMGMALVCICSLAIFAKVQWNHSQKKWHPNRVSNLIQEQIVLQKNLDAQQNQIKQELLSLRDSITAQHDMLLKGIRATIQEQDDRNNVTNTAAIARIMDKISELNENVEKISQSNHGHGDHRPERARHHAPSKKYGRRGFINFNCIGQLSSIKNRLHEYCNEHVEII